MTAHCLHEPCLVTGHRGSCCCGAAAVGSLILKSSIALHKNLRRGRGFGGQVFGEPNSGVDLPRGFGGQVFGVRWISPEGDDPAGGGFYPERRSGVESL